MSHYSQGIVRTLIKPPAPTKPTVGRPRIQPEGARRLHIDWLSQDHLQLLEQVGDGDKSRGLRLILDAWLTQGLNQGKESIAEIEELL